MQHYTKQNLKSYAFNIELHFFSVHISFYLMKTGFNETAI
jgi:hypothetical protein